MNGPRGPYARGGYRGYGGYGGGGYRWWAPWSGWGWWNRWWYGPYYGYYAPYGYGGYGGYGYGYGRSYGWIACCVVVVFLIAFIGIYMAIGNGWWYYGQPGNTLNYNSQYTQSQYALAGSNVTFSFSTKPTTPLTVALSDVPLSQLPITTVSGSFSDSFSITANNYVYEEPFLNAGSTFNITFTCSSAVDFFIADANNFNNWNQYQYYTTYYEANLTTANGLVAPSLAGGVPLSQDYYLVWYNEVNANSVSVSLTINYNMTDSYNFTSTHVFYSQENVVSLSQITKTIPTTGTWYLIIYFEDPWYSDQGSTGLSSSVSWSGSPAAAPTVFPWVYVIPIVLALIFIIVCVAVLGSRKKARQKMAKQMALTPGPIAASGSPQAPTPGQIAAPAVAPSPPIAANPATCVSCGAALVPGAIFCNVCGKKQEGRQVGRSGVTTPARSTICSLCGADIEPSAKFCPYCGTKVEQ